MGDDLIDDTAPAPERSGQAYQPRPKRMTRDTMIEMELDHPTTSMPTIRDSYPDDARRDASRASGESRDYLRRQRAMRIMRQFKSRGTRV